MSDVEARALAQALAGFKGPTSKGKEWRGRRLCCSTNFL